MEYLDWNNIEFENAKYKLTAGRGWNFVQERDRYRVDYRAVVLTGSIRITSNSVFKDSCPDLIIWLFDSVYGNNRNPQTHLRF